MRPSGSPSSGLAGSLLIAHPSLGDPNFSKTVLFLSEHQPEEGSFGLILNRPANKLVGDVLAGQGLGGLLRLPVFYGGPVGGDQLTFAALIWDPKSKRMRCRHHLGLEEAQAGLLADHTSLRAFIGYSGWSKGQLEAELAQKAWLVTPPSSQTLDVARSPLLWRSLLGDFGPWYRLVAEAPEDLSQN